MCRQFAERMASALQPWGEALTIAGLPGTSLADLFNPTDN